MFILISIWTDRYNYMASGWQNAACLSNRPDFILSGFYQWFLSRALFLTPLNPATNYFVVWISYLSNVQIFLVLFISGIESNFIDIFGTWARSPHSTTIAWQAHWLRSEALILLVPSFCERKQTQWFFSNWANADQYIESVLEVTGRSEERKNRYVWKALHRTLLSTPPHPTPQAVKNVEASRCEKD